MLRNIVFDFRCCGAAYKLYFRAARAFWVGILWHNNRNGFNIFYCSLVWPSLNKVRLRIKKAAHFCPQLTALSVIGMSVILKTIVMIPIMFIGAYVYAASLIAVGRRSSEDRPAAIVGLAGTLVWLAYIPFLLAPFFWLILTEIKPLETEEVWPAIKMLVLILISYFVMVLPGFYYIFKFRINELRKYGYFVSNT